MHGHLIRADGKLGWPTLVGCPRHQRRQGRQGGGQGSWQGRQLWGQHLKAHHGALEPQAAAQLGAGEHQGAGRASHPRLAHPTRAGGGEHFDALGTADLAKRLLQLLGLQAQLPGVHRAVLIKIGHAHQVGKLLAPEITAVFGAATGAAVKNSVGQAGTKHQHLAAGANHRLTG